MMKSIDNEIAKLVDKISSANNTYYNDKPGLTLSNQDYDKLIERLRELDPTNSILAKVGAPIFQGPWTIKKHKSIIGSLNKVNSKNEFLEWAKDKNNFIITPKADGCTLVATYKDGKLISILSRGDGIEGEDLTENAKLLSNIRQTLDADYSGEIRGEAILNIKAFNKHFAPLGYKNPRNTANGKLRDQKAKDLLPHIEVMWFDAIPADRDLSLETDKFKLIKDLGLKPIAHEIAKTADEVWQIFERYNISDRAKLNYEIDGLVCRIQNLDEQSQYGFSNNRPKGAIAIKFPSMTKESILVDVEWNRGLTGRYAPVGIIQPISLGGVEITRVTLHNLDNITKLGLNIGDKVLIERCNDIIPGVASRISGNNNQPIKPPTKCKECNNSLARDGAYVICSNQECQGDVYGSLMTWIQELNIKGFGPSIIRELINNNITDIAKLYEADKSIFCKASNSEKTGEKLYNTIQNTKEIELSKFLSGLNINTLGTTNGQRLAKRYHTINAVLNADIENLQTISGIATNATKINKGLTAKKDLIIKLQKLLTIKEFKMSGPLAGKSICITGELSKPRPIVQEWVKQNGGEIKTSVGKELTYLVTNEESTSTKTRKAKEYGIKIINEEELYKLAA